jgi:hypothetical protein
MIMVHLLISGTETMPPSTLWRDGRNFAQYALADLGRIHPRVEKDIQRLVEDSATT